MTMNGRHRDDGPDAILGGTLTRVTVFAPRSGVEGGVIIGGRLLRGGLPPADVSSRTVPVRAAAMERWP